MRSRSARIASNDSGVSGGVAGICDLMSPGAVLAITGNVSRCAVIGDPVHDSAAVLAEFFGRHDLRQTLVFGDILRAAAVDVAQVYCAWGDAQGREGPDFNPDA